MARPTPSSVPDNPAWSAIEVPCTTRPKCRATSPSAATAPNCPKPEARAMSATATTAGSDHERSPRSSSGRFGMAIASFYSAMRPAARTPLAPRLPRAHLVGCPRPSRPSARTAVAVAAPSSRDPNPPAHRHPRTTPGTSSHHLAGPPRPGGRGLRPSPAHRPGRVGADTKAYLYLDPTRWLSVSASMWDPDLAMGSVTHEYIGYLLPMGPYYALMHVLGVPTWVAQRLWTGSLLFLAGAGVLFLLRTLSPSTGRPGAGSLDMGTVGGLGALVGALGYMLSPYVMQYEARESVLLLPWVGLPWMVGSIARAVRRGWWRYPAMFALVVALVGSTNAASLLFVAVGPVLWVVWELVTGRVTWRRALSTTAKVGALTVAVCAWWIAGLAVEGAYLGNILRDTESIPTVARSSLASETLRGLGYWFFYGVDKLGLYLPTAGAYMTSLWLLAVSFAVPATAFLAAFFVRWRERAYFVGLILVGTILAVGAHPLSDPSPLGSVVKAGSANSTAGLALRSTNRATPLVILGVAVLLGAAIAALARRWKIAGTIAALAAAGLVAADIPALWTGQFVTASLSRPENVPAYWTKAAQFLDAQPGASRTRVLTEPGIDFAYYRWGTTLDPVLPGLMTRPEVDRGVVPYGSTGSSNLLTALDEEVQEGTLDPGALAPMARLMSAGDVVVQSDLQYERYDTPRPPRLVADPRPPSPGPGRARRLREPGADGGQAGEVPPDRRDRARAAPRRRLPPAGGGVPRARGPAHPAHRGREPPLARGRRRERAGGGGRRRTPRRTGHGPVLAVVRR